MVFIVENVSSVLVADAVSPHPYIGCDWVIGNGELLDANVDTVDHGGLVDQYDARIGRLDDGGEIFLARLVSLIITLGFPSD